MKIKTESLAIKIASIVFGLLLFLTLSTNVLNYEYVAVGKTNINSLSFFEASNLGGLVLASQVMVFVALFLVVALFVVCFLEYFIKEEYKGAVKVVYIVLSSLLLFFVVLSFIFMIIWVCRDDKGLAVLEYTSDVASWSLTFGVWYNFFVGAITGLLFLADSLDMELVGVNIKKFSLKRRTKVKVLGEDDNSSDDE